MAFTYQMAASSKFTPRALHGSTVRKYVSCCPLLDSMGKMLPIGNPATGILCGDLRRFLGGMPKAFAREAFLVNDQKVVILFAFLDLKRLMDFCNHSIMGNDYREPSFHVIKGGTFKNVTLTLPLKP